jgi:hypothetical protein
MALVASIGCGSTPGLATTLLQFSANTAENAPRCRPPLHTGGMTIESSNDEVRRRVAAAADEHELFIEDEDAYAKWRRKWAPPCPDGDPQRLRRALGFRERNVGELELRVPLSRGEHGACRVVVDELGDEVYVRVLVCYDEHDDEAYGPDREYVDCPVRVWLDRPLGERAVIDHDTDEELPIYVPEYVNGVRRPDHGYHPANRRKRPTRSSLRASRSRRPASGS